jgi:hypothetical protein
MDLVRARKLYFDPKVKGSASARATFRKYHPEIKASVLDRLFALNHTVQQWHPAKKAIPGEQMAMTARYFGQYLQCDTGFFKIQSGNGISEMVPVLGVADVWSRAFYARTMARPTAQEVVAALTDIMATDVEPNRPFRNLAVNFVTDQGEEDDAKSAQGAGGGGGGADLSVSFYFYIPGKEFVNATVSTWLRAEGYNLFTLSSSSSKGEKRP